MLLDDSSLCFVPSHGQLDCSSLNEISLLKCVDLVVVASNWSRLRSRKSSRSIGWRSGCSDRRMVQRCGGRSRRVTEVRELWG